MSFLNAFIPFLKLVTESLMLTSPMQHCVNTIFRALGRSFEWDQLESVLDEALDGKGASIGGPLVRACSCLLCFRI